MKASLEIHPIDGVELTQRTEQPFDIVRRASVHDVEIERVDGGSLDHGGDATDDDEVDSMPGEHPEELSDLRRSGHTVLARACSHGRA